MGDSTMTVIAIIIAVVIMVVLPLGYYATNVDEKTKMEVQTATDEFVNNVKTTGVITLDDYNNFLSTLTATGNSYNVDMMLQIAEGNPSKKEQTSVAIGSNIYQTEYNSQIIESIEASPNKRRYLKTGDIFSVTVENTNNTIGQQFKRFVNKLKGESEKIITAEAQGLVTSSGR